MPAAWAAGISAVGSVAAGAMSADSSRKAAHQQQDAANAANAQQRADQAPWMQAGGDAVTRLAAGLQPGGEFTNKFTMADATNSEAMKEAQRGGAESIQNSAAAKGGLIGSNVMSDLTKFGQANAAQYQNQAFNQWNTEQNRQLGAVQSLAGLGQTSAQNVADSSANLTLASGNAGAAGTVGASNAMSSGVSGAANQISMLAGLFGTGGGGGGGSSSSGSGYAAYDAGGYGMPSSVDTSTGTQYRPSDNYGG